MNSISKVVVMLFFGCLIITNISHGADNTARCGFQLGGNFANFHGNPQFEDSELRLRFGLFAAARVARHFSYQVELNYVQKGSSGRSVYVNYEYDSTWFDVEVQVDYIEVPLMIKAEPLPGSQLHPVFSGGVYAAWVLEKHYFGDHYQPAKSDFGLLFCFGLESVISGRTLIMETRYTIGAKSIIDDPLGYPLKNRALSFTLGMEL